MGTEQEVAVNQGKVKDMLSKFERVPSKVQRIASMFEQQTEPSNATAAATQPMKSPRPTGRATSPGKPTFPRARSSPGLIARSKSGSGVGGFQGDVVPEMSARRNGQAPDDAEISQLPDRERQDETAGEMSGKKEVADRAVSADEAAAALEGLSVEEMEKLWADMDGAAAQTKQPERRLEAGELAEGDGADLGSVKAGNGMGLGGVPTTSLTPRVDINSTAPHPSAGSTSPDSIAPNGKLPSTELPSDGRSSPEGGRGPSKEWQKPPPLDTLLGTNPSGLVRDPCPAGSTAPPSAMLTSSSRETGGKTPKPNAGQETIQQQRSSIVQFGDSSTVEAEAVRRRAELAQLEADVERRRAELSKLRVELATASSEKLQADLGLRRVQQELRDWKEGAEAAAGRAAAGGAGEQEEKAAGVVSGKAAEVSAAVLRAKLTRVKEEVEVLRKREQSLQADVTYLEASLAKEKKEGHEARRRLSESKALRRDAERELQWLRPEVASLRKSVALLERRLAAEEEDAALLRQQLQKAQAAEIDLLEQMQLASRESSALRKAVLWSKEARADGAEWGPQELRDQLSQQAALIAKLEAKCAEQAGHLVRAERRAAEEQRLRAAAERSLGDSFPPHPQQQQGGTGGTGTAADGARALLDLESSDEGDDDPAAGSRSSHRTVASSVAAGTAISSRVWDLLQQVEDTKAGDMPERDELVRLHWLTGCLRDELHKSRAQSYRSSSTVAPTPTPAGATADAGTTVTPVADPVPTDPGSTSPSIPTRKPSHKSLSNTILLPSPAAAAAAPSTSPKLLPEDAAAPQLGPGARALRLSPSRSLKKPSLRILAVGTSTPDCRRARGEGSSTPGPRPLGSSSQWLRPPSMFSPGPRTRLSPGSPGGGGGGGIGSAAFSRWRNWSERAVSATAASDRQVALEAAAKAAGTAAGVPISQWPIEDATGHKREPAAGSEKGDDAVLWALEGGDDAAAALPTSAVPGHTPHEPLPHGGGQGGAAAAVACSVAGAQLQATAAATGSLDPPRAPTPRSSPRGDSGLHPPPGLASENHARPSVARKGILQRLHLRK